MKLGLFSFLAVVLPACIAVDTPPSGSEEQSAERTLAEDFEGWCHSACNRLSECGAGCECEGDVCTCTGVDDDCPEECQEELGSYLGLGEDCAQIAVDLMECVDAVGCDALDGRVCNHSEEAELSACGERDGGSDSDDPGEVTPAGPHGIVCRAGSGGGSAGSAGGGNVSSFSCETVYEQCSDGARYHFVCDGSTELATCHCFRSGEFSGSFTLSPATCPDTATVNALCNWNLLNGF